MSSNFDSQNDSGNTLPDSPVSSYSTDRSSPSSSSSSPEPSPRPSIPKTSTRNPFTHSATFNYYQRPSPSPGFRQKISPYAPRQPFFPTALSSSAPAAASSSNASRPAPQPAPHRPPIVEFEVDSDEDDLSRPLNPEPLVTVFPHPPKPTPTSSSSSEESSSEGSRADSTSDCLTSSSELAIQRIKSCIAKPFKKIVAEKMAERDKEPSVRKMLVGQG